MRKAVRPPTTHPSLATCNLWLPWCLEEMTPITLLHREASPDWGGTCRFCWRWTMSMRTFSLGWDSTQWTIRQALTWVAPCLNPLPLILEEKAQLLISLWGPRMSPFTWSREGTWVRYLDVTSSKQIQKVGGLCTRLEGTSLGKSLDPLNSQ